MRHPRIGLHEFLLILKPFRDLRQDPGPAVLMLAAHLVIGNPGMLRVTSVPSPRASNVTSTTDSTPRVPTDIHTGAPRLSRSE